MLERQNVIIGLASAGISQQDIARHFKCSAHVFSRYKIAKDAWKKGCDILEQTCGIRNTSGKWPRVSTPENIAKIKELAVKGMSQSQICKTLKMSCTRINQNKVMHRAWSEGHRVFAEWFEKLTGNSDATKK